MLKIILEEKCPIGRTGECNTGYLLYIQRIFGDFAAAELAAIFIVAIFLITAFLILTTSARTAWEEYIAKVF